ncbi:hypothetical protein TGPRC2_257685 [Toxoplasma gondii TgCatPRC2]|uniref:Uncharacterized protein n=1 Tax=Toxoplasma gondii TgCatPRC2 TaxID=1130821 RepID=A0A151H0M4_TOXGO|nr:hypothetical protein TGPRC2_257685 [Toxoplasma gondii TgCatPRC2]
MNTGTFRVFVRRDPQFWRAQAKHSSPHSGRRACHSAELYTYKVATLHRRPLGAGSRFASCFLCAADLKTQVSLQEAILFIFRSTSLQIFPQKGQERANCFSAPSSASCLGIACRHRLFSTVFSSRSLFALA